MIGTRIKKLRLERGEGLRSLARLAKISAPFLLDIENGRRNPSEKTLAKLAKALDVPVSDLTNEVK